VIATRSRWRSTKGSQPPDAVEDEELAARAQRDGTVFALLYDRYVDSVYRYCYRRLGNETTAEDATSLVFVRALTALPRFDPGGSSFRSWLFAIAHNAIVDVTRSASARLNRPLETAADLTDPAPSPDDLALDAERRRSVGAALATLPDDQRRVVELRLAGLSGPEIAATTGRTHAAVRTAQRRAIARLRSLLHVTTDEENLDG
jgi:RNA polymerase sigma-70 factor (ECF subfamily)